MTEILRAFWKEKRPERIAVLVSGILFAVIFWIYKIPVEIAGYAFLLVNFMECDLVYTCFHTI